LIPWVTIRPALVELITGIANDAALEPQWAHRVWAHESPSIQQSIFLRVSTVAQEGTDQDDYDDVDGELYESLSGHRLITLEIKCDSFVEADGEWSFQTAERIRTRLGRRTSRDALLALNMSVVETLPAIGAHYVKEGHRRNVATFDTILRCTFTDVSADPTDHWTQIELTSDIKHADDTSVSSPPNFEDEQVPA
jgi:hypothetical protein